MRTGLLSGAGLSVLLLGAAMNNALAQQAGNGPAFSDLVFTGAGVTALAFTWPGSIGRRATRFEAFGDGASFALPVGAALISVLHGDWQGLGQWGASYSSSVLVTRGLKALIDRKRPNGSGHDAFPSGHASNAFSAASYLHFRYGWQWGLPAYALAGVVGYSRVKADKHRWSDVLGGAAVGIATSYLFTEHYDPAVRILPYAGARKHEFGLLAKIRF